jgi:hypothetical protein
MVHQLALSQAIDGFLRYKLAAGMSPHTISDYGVSFRKLQAFLPDDPPLSHVGKENIVGFFAWLQDGYISESNGVAPRTVIHACTNSSPPNYQLQRSGQLGQDTVKQSWPGHLIPRS